MAVCRNILSSYVAKKARTKKVLVVCVFALTAVSSITLWPLLWLNPRSSYTDVAASQVVAKIRGYGETKDEPLEKLTREKLPRENLSQEKLTQEKLQKEKLPEKSSLQNETEELLQILETRFRNYKGKRLHWQARKCPETESEYVRGKFCLDTRCPRQFSSQSLQQRLQQILDTRVPIPAHNLQTMMSATEAVTAHKYIFVAGASNNHYNEMQGMLYTFFREVLPRMQGEDWTVVIFDLGLTAQQRNLTEKHCRCTLIDFPMAALPDFAKHLKCFVWKPLVVASLLEKAEYLIWMDASIRWLNTTPIADLFKRAKAGGIQSRINGGVLGTRAKPAMAQFFGDHICQYSAFPEMQTGLVVYYNDRFMREAILQPWLSCAFNSTCMCPGDPGPLWACGDLRMGRYGRCHRFEQSAIGMMFSKLYLEHRPMLHIPASYVLVQRDQKMNWFERA